MKEMIEAFLNQKHLSANSRQAYQYDLEQFVTFTDGQIDDYHLRLYQTFLGASKISVQKRKLSAVNQFLLYLYETKQLEQFFKLRLPKEQELQKDLSYALLSLDHLWGESAVPEGRLMALLILELGLLPTEILTLKVSQISLDFQIATIEKEGNRRVLQLSTDLCQALQPYLSGTYLLDKAGRPYSRQWAFRKLEAFLAEKSEAQLSAQKLREQYILRQLEAGEELHEIARKLGLKTIQTLEKYKHGYKN